MEVWYVDFNQSIKSEFLTRGWNSRCQYKVHESKVDMWIVTAECLGMIARTRVSLVCGRNRSEREMDEC